MEPAQPQATVTEADFVAMEASDQTLTIRIDTTSANFRRLVLWAITALAFATRLSGIDVPASIAFERDINEAYLRSVV
jgi:hypothetical protein